MTDTRDNIFASLRRSLKVGDHDATRRGAVTGRLDDPPAGIIPARGKLAHDKQVKLFCEMAEAVQTTIDRVATRDDVPTAIAQYLRAHNLPQTVRRGDDERLAMLPWERQKTLDVATGPSDGDDPVGLAHAYAGVAETGTLILQSGADNPSTLNFLPETHIVIVAASDIVGDYESVWTRLRAEAGKGRMPRTINMITGPSRSGDIEQTILLGAHGPKQLHIIVVGDG